MYPDFQYLFQELFHVPVPEWVGVFKTFGFLMALAFMAALYVITKEMRRKQQLGLLVPTEGEIEIKDPVTGKKVKQKAMIWPHERMGAILMLAAIGGLVGAKVFNAFESWDYFLQDPIGSLFSRSGLTFYGGLITAAVLIYFYARKYKIPFDVLCDAAGPGLMLAYGIGRLGCHFSGDGDGIFNSAYVSDMSGALHLAPATKFQEVVKAFPDWFMRYSDFKNMHELSNIPHAYVPAPSWLPDWFLGMNYAHNVNNEGLMMPGCNGNYCTVLPVSVFPTALYEAITCIGLFFLLWSLRGRFTQPLKFFGLYLVLNGVERFLIEKIRVNYEYDWGFMHPSQAEIISAVLIVIGMAILLFYKRKNTTAAPHVVS
ncbi:MAG: prolipoprotein diacylglyceryl transferase [Rubrivivax sp.]